MPAQVIPEKQQKKKRKGKEVDSDSDSSSDGTDTEMLDVSFSFFDPQPHDYSSIVLLLTQLLSSDAKDLDLGGIAELVLEQKLVGSTVKTDGNEGDPYAILTVLNLNIHKSKPPISSLLTYLISKTSSHTPLHTLLSSIVSSSSSSSPTTESTPTSPTHIGLVLSERLVNMPVQIMPPMYKMLGEELQWARDDKEPYHFSHLLFLSRVFLASKEDFEEDPNASLEANDSGKKSKKSKKSKKTKIGKGGDEVAGEGTKEGEGKGGEKSKEEVWMYHAEDEYISRYATHTHIYPFSSTQPKEKGSDSFGVEMKGQVMLVPWGAFEGIVGGLEGFLGGLE